ncbi:hypothetical protein RJ640_019390 [Escallonia rubra]|uniref:LysM domain-containing protein n=1 Tax=Escallonia rubra TaxID=112253 RepID=A0AA88QN14_9ASTE|nr:hypothetical protein RJ640_019390 [Escallonia rubra]
MERERRYNGGEATDRLAAKDSSPSRIFPVSSVSPPLERERRINGGDGSSSVGVYVTIGGATYLVHQVNKFDTLAGVAIKYGVEVADIKRINGLVTDLQMFALKSLHIPSPGRHPPSTNLANGFDTPGPSSSERTPSSRRHSDIFDLSSLKLTPSPQRKVSSAMSNLQGYYGLKPADQKTVPEGFEMAVYQKGGAHYLEDEEFAKPLPHSNPPLSHHRKSKSVANGFLPENGEVANDASGAETRNGDSSKWYIKYLRRRQKSEVDFNSRTPEKMIEDNSGGGGFSAASGSGLALRPKAASRTVSVDAEAGWQTPIPTGLGDSFVVDSSSGVRKSSSTSSLQDSESSTSSSIWPTSKWSLKSDLGLSTAAITRPIFDGLPKPITSRRNKAALD